jgi:hypothetical protein
MSITSLRGSTLPNKSFRAGRAKTRNVVTIAPDTATTFANGAAISAGGGGGGGPTISNVSVTDSGYILSNATPYIDSTGGFIKITGTGFAAGCTVYVGGNAATSTTFISATEVRAQVGAAASNAQAVYVVNTDNSVGILLNAITYSGTPSWSTGATLSSQIADISFSIALSATSDSSITYSLASGSSTPSGTTLYSNGVFAGTVTGISSDTNYSFTAVATDVENQLSARAFTVSVSSGDASFYTTALLLNGDANVWITDASTNKFLPTIAADTKPTAFSPYNTNWSAYFDGTGDYLAFSTYNTTFGAGDFTVECWVYMPVITNTYSSGIIATSNYNGVDRGWSLELNASGNPRFYLYNSSGTGVTTTSSTLLPANRWTHLAAVRSGTTVTIYMNGASIASGTNATTDNFSAPIYVATIATSFAVGVSTYSYAGYISNARIVVGTAVYTGNFTPQTSSLTSTQSSGSNIAAISSGTSLLSLQNNRFIDNSTNAFAITRNGDVAIRSFGPFVETDTVTGSGYFDGTGDWLSYSSNSAFAFGTGPYTVDAWIYLTATSTGGSPIFNAGGATNGFSFQLQGSNFGTPIVFLNKDGTGLVSTVNSTTVVRLNEWTHVAISRASTASNDTKIFINGRLDGTGTDTNDWTVTTTPRVGAGGSAGYTFAGYITDVRVIKGSALYTANFTPATSSVSSVANTSLLTLQYRRGENNHRFVDEGGNKYLVTRAGQVSQGSFSPFSPAGWSGYFNGSSDYLSIAASTGFNNVSGTTFTLEFWMYPTALASGALYNEGRTIFSTAATFPNGFRIELTTTSITWYDYVGSTRISYAASINTWTHVAFTYSSNNLIMYINGQNRGSASSVTWNNSSGAALIGALNSGSYVYYYRGYISNLRLVSNLVYTGNFTPQTSSLTSTQSSGSNIAAITTGQTVFLTLQNNRFIDANTTPKTITVGAGAPQIQAFSPFKPSAVYNPTTHGGSAYFDGTGDYITTVSTTSTILPTSTTNTFTIDGWLYPTALGALKWIFGDMQPAGGTNNVSVDISSSNKIELYWYDGNSKRAISADSVVLNQWNYFAVVVNANAITIYVNSTTAGQTGTTTLTTRSLGTSGWALGAWNSADYYSGYMSDIRWTNGVARTISSVPTAPPSLDANTSVLMNFTNGGIVDASARNVMETAGTAKISNVASKFGIGSINFGTKTDYLAIPATPTIATLAGDFTLEAWVYPADATLSNAWGIVDARQSGGSAAAWLWDLDSFSSGWQVRFYNGTAYRSTGRVQAAVWTHVAIVRSGSTMTFYINGSASGTATVSGTQSGATTNPIYIGTKDNATSAIGTLGYIDDLRITNGFARTITLPTSAHLTK